MVREHREEILAIGQDLGDMLDRRVDVVTECSLSPCFMDRVLDPDRA